MSSRKNLPQGYAGPAQGLEFDVTPDTVSNPDLTQVTSVTITVLWPDNVTTKTWTPTISPGTTTGSLTATYLPASDGSDFPQLGLYQLKVVFNTNAGPWNGKRIDYFVVPPWQWDGP